VRAMRSIAAATGAERPQENGLPGEECALFECRYVRRQVASRS
jgi:hypothetical protein